MMYKEDLTLVHDGAIVRSSQWILDGYFKGYRSKALVVLKTHHFVNDGLWHLGVVQENLEIKILKSHDSHLIIEKEFALQVAVEARVIQPEGAVTLL